MNRSFMILLFMCLCAWITPKQGAAQTFQFDDLGPYSVTVSNSLIPWGAVNAPVPIEFQGVAISGFVGYRLYLPTAIDPLQTTPDLFSNSSAPLIILNHGWAANPGDYDGLASHLASWGFAVATVNYNVFPVQFQVPIEQAFESWLLKTYLLSEAANPASVHPVRGVLSPDQNQKVGAIGHSMGGVAAIFLGGADPSFDTLVSLEPFAQSEIVLFGTCSPTALFTASAAAEPLAENYGGAVFLFEGNDDQLVNDSVDFWFSKFSAGPVAPRRLVKMSVDGVGHFGCTDISLTSTPFYPCGVTDLGDMKLYDQHLIQRRFATMCLLSEFVNTDDFENNFVDLFGDGMRDENFESAAAGGGNVPVSFAVESFCQDAIIWAKEVATPYDTACTSLGVPTRPNSIAFGVLGLPGDLDATYLLVPTTLLGGICPPGTFVYENSCVFTLYNNVLAPASTLGVDGVRECNFGISVGGFTVEMVSYLWRNGPFDLTRLADFSVAP